MESYAEVDAEVKSLRGQLATERQALAKLRTEYDAACILVLDDQEAAAEAISVAQTIAVAEARVRGLEVLLSEKATLLKGLQVARGSAVAAELATKAEVELEAKRVRLTQAVRVARERVEELKSRIPGATAVADAAQGRFVLADHAFQQHINRDPDPLATEAEVRKHAERCERLAEAREEARQEVNAATEGRNLAEKAYRQACGALFDAQNILRWNVAPSPEEQRRNSGAAANV